MHFRDNDILSDTDYSLDAPYISFTITAGENCFYQNVCLKRTFFTSKYIPTANYDKMSFDGYMSKVPLTFTFNNTYDSIAEDAVTITYTGKYTRDDIFWYPEQFSM